MSRPADPLAKAKLLRAARQVFAMVGLTEARVEDIAKRAEVAKGSFYLHFKSKEQAFHEIVDHFLAALQEATDKYHPDCVRAADLPVEETMDMFMAHDLEILECLWANRDIMCMIYRGGKVLERYQNTLDAFLDGHLATPGAMTGGRLPIEEEYLQHGIHIARQISAHHSTPSMTFFRPSFAATNSAIAAASLCSLAAA